MWVDAPMQKYARLRCVVFTGVSGLMFTKLSAGIKLVVGFIIMY